MYTRFFGFKERPFKLVPNPEYLYLGRGHEEAMAHLNYAVCQGDGFVLITGEVGTGKTTLCRAFLEGLDDTVKTAYIFNPKLDSLQLLKAINDEFGVDSGPDTVKALIDGLNAFLMEIKREGKSALLLIDEAQNLPHDVLEQVRLLSNLETTRDKLLQIILVGQPELGELLDSPNLRQLRQRIAISCHLTPFDRKETESYIRHRLNIASVKPSVLFTRRAVNAVFDYSGGVARKINILCDRSLLTAYGLDRKTVDHAIVRSAIRELSGKGEPRPYGFTWITKKWILLMVVVATGLVALLYWPEIWNPNIKAVDLGALPMEPDKAANVKVPTVASISKPVSLKQKQTPASQKATDAASQTRLKDVLKASNSKGSRQNALSAVMALWGIKSEIHPWLLEVVNDPDFFRLAANQNGFLVQQVIGQLDQINRLNLPAVLTCEVSSTLSPVYVAICRRENDGYVVKMRPDDPGLFATAAELSAFYAGTAYIPWKNFFNYSGVLPVNASEETIIALKMHLREIGFTEIDLNPVYDEKTREAIKQVQKKHALLDDGLIGPLTKIVLYNDIGRLNTPKLGG
jgi:general secretion pathway protein A